MSKKVGGVLLSLALMAPCVAFVAVPYISLALKIYQMKRDLERSHPGAKDTIIFGGFTMAGKAGPMWIFMGSTVILFIVGLVWLFRNFMGKTDIEKATDAEN